jgi:hypothetical protein
MRIGGASKLAVLRWDDFCGIAGCCERFLGIAGTGGASWGTETDCGRAGDGSRNDRSDIDPDEPLRSSPDPGRPVAFTAVEP